MSGPTTLAELLRINLEGVSPPKGYEKLRDRLAASKPTRKPPAIKMSPENIRQPGSDSGGKS
jgi:hypothetical protein